MNILCSFCVIIILVKYAFAEYSTDGEKCMSITRNKEINKYSYGHINCKENKSVYIERVWLDIKRNCEYQPSSSNSLFDEILVIRCDAMSSCKVEFYRSYRYKEYKYLNVRFQCKDCQPVHRNTTVTITCPVNSLIEIDDVWDDYTNCPAYRFPQKNMTEKKNRIRNICTNVTTCSVIFNNYDHQVTSIYYHCKDGNNTLRNSNSGSHVITTSTESNVENTHGETCLSIKRNSQDQLTCQEKKYVSIKRAWLDQQKRCSFRTSSKTLLFNRKLENCNGVAICNVPFFSFSKKYSYLNILFYCKVGKNTQGNDDGNIGFSTETDATSKPSENRTTDYHHDGPKYAVIIGGIAGVLLIICIIVGVFLLRRRYGSRNTQKPSRNQLSTELNPTYDPTHGQPEPDNNQPAHLMSSPDEIHMSTSQAVNLDNTTDTSNTYSHIRNTTEDSDVMYDHTVRHAVHNTCDGDYGIAHRRITEDDYDVSGNFRQSPGNNADPVYN
ncbi:uncharacterized protein LOC127722014 [Mytilus californianus]|uniref:uncharacterized protein LOC127722014 n=1 Tax=Mytilus californianus TaxID=6549 RepID=UPI002246FEC2|nr:uncharacterized protein LOC127722014 [Mytilus californianus]